MALELNGTTGVSLVQDGVITDANLPAGSVLQVVSASKTDTFSSTTINSYTDVTGMSASITPSSTSSKILVTFSFNVSVGGAGAADILRNFKVVKVIGGSTTDSSPIGDVSGSLNRATVINQRSPFDKNGVLSPTIHYLDSPSTTSSITYKLQFYGFQAGTVKINFGNPADEYNRGASTITLMEIAG